MTSDATARRLRRRAAQQRFDALAVEYLDLPGVSRANMFGSDGLRVDAKFFAFVGRDGQLIVKLPATQAEALMASGEASPVRAGRRTMREWIGTPGATHHDSTDRWRNLISDAYRFVASLTPASNTER